MARWDGLEWSALSGPSGIGTSGGSYPWVYSLGSFDHGSGPTLFAGGQFYAAGGVLSNNIAAWSCSLHGIFFDDFESGDTSSWSLTTP